MSARTCSAGLIHDNYEAAKRARNAGLEVVMDHCMKVEHGRFFGNLSILGFNTGVISARRVASKRARTPGSP